MKKFAVALFIMVSALFAAQAQAQLIVIANPSVKASQISKSDLRDVFSGASTSLPDGTRVVPILLKAGTTHEEFLQVFIGKNDSAYRAGWRSLVFSGQASMPKSLETDAEIVAFVLRSNGAIGYINKNSPHEGVKVLTVR